jgi:hypothetical protein
MSAAAALADLPSRSGRQHDRTADHVTEPYRAFHIATLLRQVINYAKALVVTVRQRAAAPDFALFAEPFGTSDVRLILGRIARAIRRAAAVEDDMLKVARLGRHIFTRPRAPSDRARSPRESCPSEAPAEPAARRDAEPGHPLLDRLPSAARIAAQIRRHPIGVVVASICRDLGITPNHELWPALSEVVAAHGGNLEELRQEIEERCPPEHWPPAPDPDKPDTGKPGITLHVSEIFAAAEQVRQWWAGGDPPDFLGRRSI